MAEKFEWKKKDGEDWHELKIDLKSLNLDQSLKVQEMFDNKNHQHLQEKFNKIIIILTAFIVLGGIFQFVLLACNKFGLNLTPWFWVFGFAYLIAGLLFLYISIPPSWIKRDKSNKANNPFNLWLVLDLFVRIMTMLAIVVILAKYMQGVKLTIFIVLFILWAFRPIYLAFKEIKQK
jgi:hypothetical protein